MFNSFELQIHTVFKLADTLNGARRDENNDVNIYNKTIIKRQYKQTNIQNTNKTPIYAPRKHNFSLF